MQRCAELVGDACEVDDGDCVRELAEADNGFNWQLLSCCKYASGDFDDCCEVMSFAPLSRAAYKAMNKHASVKYQFVIAKPYNCQHFATVDPVAFAKHVSEHRQRVTGTRWRNGAWAVN